MDIRVKDNVLEDPDTIRADALKLGTFEGVDFQDHFFPGVELKAQPSLEHEIEDLVGAPIHIDLQFWRMSRPGDESPTGVHADQACSSHAALLYLSPTVPVEMDGTAFWRHKELDDNCVPEYIRRGSKAAQQEYYDRVNADTKNPDAWDMTMLVKSQYNRLVTYPSHYYHSRHPLDSTNNGTTLETARLVWVAFFNIL